jgi:DNA helicase-2/ATP-dependent DNA helicase PcrA
MLTLAELRPGQSTVAPAAMIEAVLFAVYDDYMRDKFPNYDARREDLNTLQSYAKQFTTTEEFLAQLALLGGVETTEALASDRDDNDKVTLSSVHQAKGLEWRSVFVVWLSDGMFPTSRSLDRDEDVEEERRLFYVAVTRCKDELYLTYPELRLNAGYGEAFQRPSRFLSELPGALYEEWEVQAGFKQLPAPGKIVEDPENEPW